MTAAVCDNSKYGDRSTLAVVADDEASFFGSRVTFLLINGLGGHVTKIQTETACVKFQSASLISTTLHDFPIHRNVYGFNKNQCTCDWNIDSNQLIQRCYIWYLYETANSYLKLFAGKNIYICCGIN